MIAKCMKFKVCGRVQGVGFRYSTAYHGLKLGVTGYAKNLYNGDVEVVVCGNEEQISSMEQYLQQGPRSARVDELSKEEADFKAYKGFDIL
ncbi:acylphosphatase [Vibrio ichthyoenteri ATCC 700023]|uniref:Acylphosphatase n=1 Tax=Vibrio ichthyoenteri ATCC 700023 TaxID=870968 RepID=F9S2I9_9VIBR|nr:acylphosphatase [Vibrio ichthyoenteri]EGU39535.1 acylphosphatase [Vibrio ichthyoenteri ATCC 700023]